MNIEDILLLLFDRRLLLHGSYNWTRSAATANEENIVSSNDPELVACFLAQFASLWSALVGQG